MALAQYTDFLLLDELTTFLDITYQIELLELFSDLNHVGHTVVAVLHDLTHAARFGTHLIAMKDAAIVAEGPPSKIVTVELVEEVFGMCSLVVPDPVVGTPHLVPLGRGPETAMTSDSDADTAGLDHGRLFCWPPMLWADTARTTRAPDMCGRKGPSPGWFVRG